MSVQIKFDTSVGVSFDNQVHSYAQLMQKLQSEKDIAEAMVDDHKEIMTTLSQSEQHQDVSEKKHHNLKKDNKMQEKQDVPPILRVIDRDDSNTLTEYLLSRPVTFAHKCEDVMATCSVLAIMTGIGAIGTIYHSDIIPSHNQIALGFVCATGICLLGTVLSGVAGGISDCWQERKNRLMQEKMEHTRD